MTLRGASAPMTAPTIPASVVSPCGRYGALSYLAVTVPSPELVPRAAAAPGPGTAAPTTAPALGAFDPFGTAPARRVSFGMPPPPPAAPPVGPWSCAVCTYANSPGDAACGMCGNARPEPAVAGGRDTTQWSCPTCTFINSMTDTACSVCTSARPDDAGSLAPLFGDAHEDAELAAALRATLEGGGSHTAPVATGPEGVCSHVLYGVCAVRCGCVLYSCVLRVGRQETPAHVWLLPFLLPAPRIAVAREREDREAAEAVAIGSLQAASGAKLCADLLQAAAGLVAIENRRVAHQAASSPIPLTHAASTNSPLTCHLSPAAFWALSLLVDAAPVVDGGVGDPLAGPAPAPLLALNLASALLDRMHAARASPQDLLLVGPAPAASAASASGSGAAPSRSHGIAALSTSLLRLLHGSGSGGSSSGAGTLAAGTLDAALGVVEKALPLLFPDPRERASFVASRISEILGGGVPADSPRYRLVATVLACSAKGEGVPAVLAGPINQDHALFQVLLQEASRALGAFGPPSSAASGGAGAGAVAPMAVAACAVLNAYQRHLLTVVYDAASAAGPAAGDTLPPSTLATLTSYAAALTGHCTTVLEQAQGALLARRVTPDAVCAALGLSAVGAVLPFFASALCLLARDLAAAEALLPLLVSTIRVLDTVCSHLPQVTAGDRDLLVAAMEQQQQECNLVVNDDVEAAAAVHDSGLSSSGLPLLLDVLLTLASAAARFAATMIAAVPEEVGA